MPKPSWKDQMFTHDCDNCLFLGHWEDPEVTPSYGHYDLYACPEHDGSQATLIARYSSQGEDYVSMPYALVTHDRVLLVAKTRYDEYLKGA